MNELAPLKCEKFTLSFITPISELVAVSKRPKYLSEKKKKSKLFLSKNNECQRHWGPTYHVMLPMSSIIFIADKLGKYGGNSKKKTKLTCFPYPKTTISKNLLQDNEE